jgi:hypothetical protein
MINSIKINNLTISNSVNTSKIGLAIATQGYLDLGIRFNFNGVEFEIEKTNVNFYVVTAFWPTSDDIINMIINDNK